MAIERESRIKEWAHELGFDRVGIAQLETSQYGDFYRRWLDRGDHAEMEYLERRVEAREDPAQIGEGARSVVCVALQYAPLLDDPAEDDPLWSRVAKYARGRDYHNIMGRRLKRLAAKVREAFPGVATKPYVDTGPVLERELAARAGLGAIGKNTNLLHPEAGSWFLLGELFLSIDLNPDTPLADLCGSCSRCLDACPTGALPAPYHLDSNRCISYWTIEHRGVIPPDMREAVGEWVFGCDICQDVCPLNDFPEPFAGADFRVPENRADLDMEQLLEMNEADFASRFQGSPMRRAKLEGLKRNVAVTMGRIGDSRHIPSLRAALGSASAVVRTHVAWALGRFEDSLAVEALKEALKHEKEGSVRAEIIAALGAESDDGNT